MQPKTFAKWILGVVAWVSIGAIGTFFSYHMSIDWGKKVTYWEVAHGPMVEYLTWGALFTPIVLWLGRKFRIERSNWPNMIGLHLLFSVGLASVSAALRLPTHHWVYPKANDPVSFMLWRAYFYSNGFDDIWMYWVVLLLNLGWAYYQKYRDRELKASLLETKLARTQLEVLKFQLHPHFLFNTLNSVSELMHQDLAAADRMIIRLSELLRLTLETGGAQEIPLKQELEFLEGYLEIERTRFQDRLSVLFDIDPETLDARVPNMFLQPLVENAVRHGVAKRAGKGTITIRSHRTGYFLHLILADNGPGIQAEKLAKLNGGVGLANTRSRLQVLYPEMHTFEIRTPAQGGCEIRITLPFHGESQTSPQESEVTIPDSVRPIPAEVRP
ncbi:MAG TPA: histidine kinase [Terriglobales bacterium]|nr:histidine kinase [Terriglobales bacterium]